MRDIQDVWMRLESLKHLRGMPKLRRLHDKIEAELAEIQNEVSPKEEEKAPATVEPEEPEEDLRQADPEKQEDDESLRRV